LRHAPAKTEEARMSRSSYDPAALLERAALWRAEAADASLEEMRAYCLAEADQCERRVLRSRSTPVLHEKIDRQGGKKAKRSPVRGSSNLSTK
jgi:hypothetical protein